MESLELNEGGILVRIDVPANEDVFDESEDDTVKDEDESSQGQVEWS